MLVQMLIT